MVCKGSNQGEKRQFGDVLMAPWIVIPDLPLCTSSSPVCLRMVFPEADPEMWEWVKVLESVSRKYQQGHGEMGQEEKAWD